MTTLDGNWNVASMAIVPLTPGQRPAVMMIGNATELLIVKRCVALFHALLAMRTGLDTVKEQPENGGLPTVTPMTGPEPLTAVRSTEVVLVAVNVHSPAVVTVVGVSPWLLLHIEIASGLVVPTARRRFPEAVRLPSTEEHVQVAPPPKVNVFVVPATNTPVTATPCGSQLTASAAGAATSEVANTKLNAAHLNTLMIHLLADGAGPRAVS